MHKIILSGTANAGKSRLLEEIRLKGFKTVPEAETPIVLDLRDKLGYEGAKSWILANYCEFKEIVGEKQARLDSEVEAAPDEYVFFDRHGPDWIGYCHMRNSKVPKNLEILADQVTSAKVYFVERLSIFNERKETGRFMTEEESIILSGLILHEYQKRGNNIIHVPEFSQDMVENLSMRVNHILKSLQY